MITNFSEVQVNINSKISRFCAQQDMTFPEVKESLFQLLKIFGQIEDNAKAQSESQEKPEEQVKTE